MLQPIIIIIILWNCQFIISSCNELIHITYIERILLTITLLKCETCNSRKIESSNEFKEKNIELVLRQLKHQTVAFKQMHNLISFIQKRLFDTIVSVLQMGQI